MQTLRGEADIEGKDLTEICESVGVPADMFGKLINEYNKRITSAPAKALYNDSYAAAYKRKLSKEKANQTISEAAEILNEQGKSDLALELGRFVGKIEG